MTRSWRQFWAAATVVLVTLSAGACGRQAPPPEAPAPAPAAAPASTDDAARRAAEERARREAEEAARREAERKRAVLEEMVFFDFDVSTIRPDARRVLDQKVEILRADAGIRLTIAGHADERGSTEYNLALGMRRANAIREYLTGFGLGADRFATRSYGEERPLVRGTGESSWSRNRRGEFNVTAGLAATQR